MMNAFLLWRRLPEQDPTPERVGERLQSIFAPLFEKPPDVRIRQSAAATLVFLDVPVRGWKPPLVQEDEETWVFAPDYPVNADAVAATAGLVQTEGRALPALCRKLEKDGGSLLGQLVPPFSLIWYSKKAEAAYVQNDGLGRSQLFECEEGQRWALTNKPFALKALGHRLEPVGEQWAVRWTLGWFPLNLSGFKAVRFLEPSTRFCLSPEGLRRTRKDVLREWLGGDEISEKDCLELARTSLIRHIEDVLPQMRKPTVSLTGGWDSRAIASSLRAAGTEFSAVVRGQPWRPDVVIASQLAHLAGVPIRVKSPTKAPPVTADACRRCTCLALLRSAGGATVRSYKTFMAHKDRLGISSATITGNTGEVGRGYYEKRTESVAAMTGDCDERLVEALMLRMPPFTRKHLRDRVREIIDQACRIGDHYGISGPARWSLFYLCERDRRFIGSHAGGRMGLVFAPFLNRNYLRACFSYPSEDQASFPFHRHIIQVNTPDWVEVPYAEELKKKLRRQAKARAEEGEQNALLRDVHGADWRRPEGRHDYSSLGYWQETGKPLIDECLARDGFWTEVFDPDLAREQWHAAPDELAVTHLLPEACG